MVAHTPRLADQIKFIETLDQLKQVFRRNKLMDATRRENSAEHSWHISIMAMMLSEYSAEPVDTTRVVQMLLIHDTIEIFADDTFCYDEAANVGKEEREQEAADNLFGMLPEDQTSYFRGLWDEFEEQETPESRFANALDRFQVLFQNRNANGGTWAEYGIRESQVRDRMDIIRQTAPGLWPTVENVIEDAVTEGYLKK